MERDELFLNWDEAMKILQDEPDTVVRALLEKASTITLTARLEGRRRPTAPFDQRFFLATLQEMFANKERLREILDGKFNRWFEDE